MVNDVMGSTTNYKPRRNVDATAPHLTDAELPIYNIPVELIDSYRGRRIIVRADKPGKLVEKLTEADFEKLCFVQISTISADLSVMATWGIGVPVDIIMHHPDADFGLLYNHAKLLDKHPLRVTVPVGEGFVKAVRVAGSLGLAVKVCVAQPNAKELAQLFEVLDMFLHQPEFSQQVEFYQGSMQSFYLDDSTSIWELQEEDPSQFRYITDHGREFAPPRSAGMVTFGVRNPNVSIEEMLLPLLSERRECRNCEFLGHCRGYFKRPNKDYLCAGGVKEIFRELKSAAGELKDDLATYALHTKAHRA